MSLSSLLGALLITSFIVSPKASAYIVATEPAALKAGQPTDIFIAGLGDDQGNQFLKAASLASKVSRDRFQQRQRIIITAVNQSLEGDKTTLVNAGLAIVKADTEELKKSNLIRLNFIKEMR